ncbi:hypothetical protein [Actinophytocola algeriensis]|uniref:Uncharacterized protein n=1 Tax=Actinophytocola algeriensis TaxID=1768010 RepID=A0A7W7Q7L9_9PSEU|nr:hypothetical protein [Actinophytocola algeriensis]MBB4908134.1 hypothetical protein [Actinophytocola algeriensis]MBE1480164.1 hypothetical protein [Actinophytocola algeriensis]
MKALVPVGLSALLLLAAPSAAAADVVFDPADADDLAATLAEATAAQNVCYGWDVQVDDAIAGQSESVGSDRGAGTPVDTSSCSKYVRLDVFITYTSESSESEDSASWDVTSSSGGPTRSDMEDLGLDWDGLTGENPDVVIGNAVSALPLLAADNGMGEGIEAAPATGAAPADASLTDSPGSDFWRNNGTGLLWGIGLLLAGGLFAWWVFRSRPPKPRAYVVPDTVPDDLAPPPYEPPTAPIAVQPDPPTEPVPVARQDPADTAPELEPEATETPETAEKLDEPPELDPPVPAEPDPSAEGAAPAEPEAPTEPEASAETAPSGPAKPAAEADPAAESTPDRPAPSDEDAAPSDQKNKE